MTRRRADEIARAVLYEGYNLYPYRASSVKNRRRFNFGVLAPRAYCERERGAEAWSMQTECLVAGEGATLEVAVRFLHLVERRVAAAAGGAPELREVESLEVAGRRHHSWQEAVEREVVVPARSIDALAGCEGGRPSRVDFAFGGLHETETLREPDGRVAGAIVREQRRVRGTVELAAGRAGDGLHKVRVRVLNTTPYEGAGRRGRDDALTRSLVSAHTVLAVAGGELVSLLDPPEELREAAARCENVGTWPVLAGEEGARDVMLSSPIILYDYPQVAPESAGDLFDATEIDEILTLRILTLTDEEKREMRDLDDRTRLLLERTETLPAEQMAKLHGAARALRPRGPR